MQLLQLDCEAMRCS